MSKTIRNIIIAMACTGAVLGAVFAYFKTSQNRRKSLENDFDDFTDEFETREKETEESTVPERTYTTLSTEPVSEQQEATMEDSVSEQPGEKQEDSLS